MEIFYPDYNRSILSVISSVLKSYSAPCSHPGLPELDSRLARPHKNKILMILDGLGSKSLDGLLPVESFLRSSKIADISSVYPCTTTAATTTMMSGLSPLEHGWLGWSPWFREYGRVVDLFLDRDSFSGAAIAPSPKLLLPYEDIVTLINRASPGAVTCHRLMPSFDPGGVASLAQMVERMGQICRMDGPQLILAYWHQPDTLMHDHGPWSEDVRREVAASDQLLGELFQTLDDTLFLLTADHGQIEVKREVFLDDIPDLNNCLIMPPSLETRAASLFVKPARKDYFAAKFQELLGDDFILMPHDEVFARGLLGSGSPSHKVDDFIGDFLACGIGQTIIRYRSNFNRPHSPFKGHHAGLCADEMIVPLVVAEN